MSESESNAELLEMQDTFLGEASDLIEQAQSLLLTIEKKADADEVWDALFRVAHNLKGSGNAVGFENLALYAHEVENLLIAVRKGQIRVSKATIDLLLDAIDQFRNDIASLKQNKTAVLSHDSIILRIQNALTQTVSPEEVESAEMGSPEEAPIRQPAVATVVDEKKTPTSSAPPASASLAAPDESIRISLKKIDDLLNNLGEQIILQSALDQARYEYESKKETILRAITQLNKLTYDIQQTAMSLRMVNLKQLFSKLERAVRDTAGLLGKKIEFSTEGGEQELDKTIVDSLSDALVHMVRNSVDHGIENADERASSNKPEVGSIRVSAYRRGGFFYIEIRDDGRGLNRDKILEKALKLNLVHPGQAMSDSDVYELIFENGFSTKEQVTETSGRGVGMDVVKESILHVKGGYQIESKVGVGTTFTIRLPLTLAVFNGMVIRVGDCPYILPNSDVEEVIKIKPEMIRSISPDEQMIQIRDQAYPLIFLRDEIDISGNGSARREKKSKDGVLIVTRINRRPYVFVADELVSQQRVVYKTLGKEAQSIRGAVGATILGDGSVALILEFSRLVRSVSGSSGRAA